jgi:hypothetical protein
MAQIPWRNFNDVNWQSLLLALVVALAYLRYRIRPR